MVGKTLTLKQRAEREMEVSKLLTDGLTVAEIAAKLGISPQAVRKFLAVRGWQPQPKH